MKKLSLILAIVLVLSSVTFALSSEIKQTETKLDDIKDTIEENKKKLEENKEEQEIVEDTIGKINASIDILEGDIEDNMTQIENKEKELELIGENLDEATLNLDNQKSDFNSRLRAMYKTRTSGYLQVVFSAKNLQDLLTRVTMLRKIVSYDQEVIEDMEDAKAKIEQIKEEQELAHKELVQLQLDLNEKEKVLSSTRSYLASREEQLKKEEDKYKQELADLEKQEKQLVNELSTLRTKAQYVGGVFTWPVPSSTRITSYFGPRIHPIYKTQSYHSGIDIGAPTGSSIVAANDGKVIVSGWKGGYGYTIMIDHGGGIVTLYGHSSKLIASVGQNVSKGETVALVGSTGWSTGPHLHFGVNKNGIWQNPLNYLKGN